MNVRASPPLAGSPVRSAIRYEPSTCLAQAQLALLNAAATRRRPFVAELGGKPLEIAVIGLESTTRDPEPLCHFGLGSGPVRSILSLPQSLVEQLVAVIQDGLGLPDEPLRSLLIELALSGLLDAFDVQFAIPTPLEPVVAPPRDFDRVMLAIHWSDWRGPAWLHVPRSGGGRQLSAIVDLLKRMPEAAASMDRLPLCLGFEIGTTPLPVALLSSLRPGDVILVQTNRLAVGEVLVALTNIAANADLAGRTATLRGRFAARHALGMETTMNEADDVKASSATLDQIEVTLTFELGRRTVDLRTLRAMAPGHTFDLGRDPEGPVDILANGRTIGSGEIVRIGDTLGVRATRLFLHD
ncbi:type III secretion system cytoplasmic ring protein SctQ [Bradyrhizobium xenonodulans]|uniref:Type III secretion system cytoplasmic ring protein SctQ n=1 Tax=Bradyrhizobium xenonodulans TaxID=2736875 RepID=A0ABY7MSK9_9BRAD|nr:type III secretion system cytoplasmic ring protein SctQ [Bradyrhizobium xenonodulans]WBL81360.1 type III secretion system cytoplasmic ring protein SctQ [Bradyrhizobium xenonodulans]